MKQSLSLWSAEGKEKDFRFFLTFVFFWFSYFRHIFFSYSFIYKKKNPFLHLFMFSFSFYKHVATKQMKKIIYFLCLVENMNFPSLNSFVCLFLYYKCPFLFHSYNLPPLGAPKEYIGSPLSKYLESDRTNSSTKVFLSCSFCSKVETWYWKWLKKEHSPCCRGNTFQCDLH